MARKLYLLPAGKIFVDRTTKSINFQLKRLNFIIELLAFRGSLLSGNAPETLAHFIEFGFKLKEWLFKIKDNFRGHSEEYK